MKKAKLLKNYKGTVKPLVVKDIESLKLHRESDIRELLFYKHHCDDRYLKRLMKRAKISRDCLKKEELRRVLIEAVKLRMES